MRTLLAMLPLAFVMIAGPQIVTAVFLATSTKPVRNSLMYLLGVTIAVSLGLGIYYGITKAINKTAAVPKAGRVSLVDVAIIILLVVLAVVVFLRRKKTTQPPKWMSKLQTATGRFSFRAGFLLYFLFPTDVITMITVGTFAAQRGLPYVSTLAFVALTVLLAGMPFILYLLLGKRADVILPKLRDWMNSNSWIVNEILIFFFLALEIKDVLTG